MSYISFGRGLGVSIIGTWFTPLVFDFIISPWVYKYIIISSKIFFYQIAFNKIINKLSNDQKFLEDILTPIAEKDEFVRKNLEISKKLVNYEHKQKIKLGIFRNDYLFDKIQNFLLFTEYNTIASSMGTFTDRVKKFYSYFSQKYPEIFKKYKEKQVPTEGFETVEKFS